MTSTNPASDHLSNDGKAPAAIIEAVKGNGADPPAEPDSPVQSKANDGASSSRADLIQDVLPAAEAAIAPLDDLMAEALSSPDEFGGATAPSPTAFPIRKPKRDEWFRVHPTFAPRIATYETSSSKRRSAVHLVAKAMMPLFGDAAKPHILRLCVTSTGNRFVWQLPQPDGGPGESWAKSRLEVVQAAITGWIAIEPGDGCYQIRRPERPDVFPEPSWPDGSPNDWLHKAFPPDMVVREPDHPAARYHRGLAASL